MITSLNLFSEVYSQDTLSFNSVGDTFTVSFFLLSSKEITHRHQGQEGRSSAGSKCSTGQIKDIETEQNTTTVHK